MEHTAGQPAMNGPPFSWLVLGGYIGVGFGSEVGGVHGGLAVFLFFGTAVWWASQSAWGICPPNNFPSSKLLSLNTRLDSRVSRGRDRGHK